MTQPEWGWVLQKFPHLSMGIWLCLVLVSQLVSGAHKTPWLWHGWLLNKAIGNFSLPRGAASYYYCALIISPSAWRRWLSRVAVCLDFRLRLLVPDIIKSWDVAGSFRRFGHAPLSRGWLQELITHTQSTDIRDNFSYVSRPIKWRIREKKEKS